MTAHLDQGGSGPDFAFPILCFTADGDIWAFRNERELTTCGPKTLEDGVQIGMILVDADGESWRVESVEPVGPAPFSWRAFRLLAPRLIQVRHRFVAASAHSLEETKARVCASLDAFPLYWCEPSELPGGLEIRKAEVRAVQSIAEIHQTLGLDYFAE